jgi:FixJ family two-component response regulator
MEAKLRCIIIDDDTDVHDLIKSFMKNSDKAVVTHCFEKCSEFLKQLDKIPFDLVFLDCMFPGDTKNGVDVALALKEVGKEFIFISAKHRSFVEACRTIGALDAMPKPITEKRFIESVDKAFQIINGSKMTTKKHALFHVKEQKGEINFCIADILYIRTHQTDPRNKIVRMKNNLSYTFMDCKFDDILELSSYFVMANKSEMISYEIVEGINGEYVLLKQYDNSKIPRAIPLSPLFKNRFKLEFH